MGFSLKKLAKKAARGIGKIGAAAMKQAVQSNPLGAAAIKASQALKAAGVAAKAARVKVQPLSVRASVEKAGPRGPKTNLAAPGPLGLVRPSGGKRKRKSTAAPGSDLFMAQMFGGYGDPIPAKGRKVKAKATRTKSTKTVTTKRKPPKGGLDLKAMSAAWKAAGKPGTWIGWIKSNPIKK